MRNDVFSFNVTDKISKMKSGIFSFFLGKYHHNNNKVKGGQDFLHQNTAKKSAMVKGRVIGIMVEDVSSLYHSMIITLLKESFAANGYNVIFSSTGNNPETIKSLIKIYREKPVDGMVIMPVPGIENEIADLLYKKFPLIFFENFLLGYEMKG